MVRVTGYEVRVACYGLRVARYEFRVEGAAIVLVVVLVLVIEKTDKPRTSTSPLRLTGGGLRVADCTVC